MQKKRTLWSREGQQMLRELPLNPWASCRREDLLGLLGMLNQQVGALDFAVQHAAEENPQAKLLIERYHYKMRDYVGTRNAASSFVCVTH